MLKKISELTFLEGRRLCAKNHHDCSKCPLRIHIEMFIRNSFCALKHIRMLDENQFNKEVETID